MSSDADITVRKVETLADKEGAQSAYNALKQDYDNFARSHGGTSSTDTKNYWFDVAYTLQQDKVLQNLAVVWGKESMGVYSKEGLTKFDLEQVKNREWPNRTDMDRTMTDQLLVQYEKLKNKHDDAEGGFIGIGTHEKDAITLKDTQAQIAALDNQMKARKLIKPLVETTDGVEAHSLFHKIDATPGGDVDGEIDRDDLERFINQHKYRQATGQNDVLTPEAQQQAGKELSFVSGLYANWDKPSVENIRGISGRYRDDNNRVQVDYNDEIEIDRLAQSGGFRDRADLFAKNEVHRNVQAPEVTIEVAPQKTVTEKQATEKAEAPVTEKTTTEKPAEKSTLEPCREVQPAQSFEMHRVAIEKLMAESQQQCGEGPYQAAARMIPGSSHREIMKLTHLLKHSYQDMNGDQTDRLVTLKSPYQWLNEDNFQYIITQNSALQRRLDQISKAG